MVARGAGAIGCAHCKKIGAEQACQICTRLVCPACAADWATCAEPSGRVVRLGLTARVRDVDPRGHLALVSHWRRPLRLFDLRRLRWIDLELPRRYWIFSRQFPPRLSGDGRLFYAEVELQDGNAVFGSIRARDLRTGATHYISGEAPFGSTGVSPTDDRYYYVTDKQQVAVTNQRQQIAVAVALDHVWLVEPLPRKVVHAAYVDGERLLLAAGSWSEIAVHELADGALRRLGYTKTETAGDVRWIAVAGSWLVAAITTPGAVSRVEVRRLRPDLSIGDIEHRHSASSSRAIALSRDGRYLAFGTADGLVVHELGTDHITTFEEHTDRINYVRFAADDHVLISADADNRIVMRPRTATGYARPLVPIEIPEERVPLLAPAPSAR
jgi:hypothetical protein